MQRSITQHYQIEVFIFYNITITQNQILNYFTFHFYNRIVNLYLKQIISP